MHLADAEMPYFRAIRQVRFRKCNYLAMSTFKKSLSVHGVLTPTPSIAKATQ